MAKKIKSCLVAALLLSAAACDSSSDGGLDRELAGADAAVEDEGDDVATPPGCAHEITLAPPGPGYVASETVATVEADGDGVDLCLHLDGTANERNHFMSGSDQEDGGVSSFVLVLLDQDGNVLVEGWDVTYGVEDPRTFANLEYGPWGPGVPGPERLADVVLRVSTKDASPRTTSIDVALFDPLE